MSRFYDKYKHLFDADSTIKLPSIKPKYSDYNFNNFEGVHKSKSRSVLPVQKAVSEYRPHQQPSQFLKHERAGSMKRPDYNDIRDRLFPKVNDDKPKFRPHVQKFNLAQMPERTRAYKPLDTLSLQQPEEVESKRAPPKWSENDSLTAHLQNNQPKYKFRLFDRDWKSEHQSDAFKQKGVSDENGQHLAQRNLPHLKRGAPFGVEQDVPKREKDEDVYSSYSRRRKHLNHQNSDDKLSVGSDHQQRGAGMSYQEIEKRRNVEYTLDDKHKRDFEKISRPVFGKDEIKNTYIPKKNPMDHMIMMQNKVKGERHTQFGESDDLLEASFDDTKSQKFDPDKLLPYGEASKHAPDVTVEESLKKRREAKKFLKQRRAKLKHLLHNEY